jgi:hypothetical protein
MGHSEAKSCMGLPAFGGIEEKAPACYVIWDIHRIYASHVRRAGQTGFTLLPIVP